MKKGIKNQKRGISLIVLVITIVVMIILASAIILSLSGSGIIGRANEAKTKSDIANAKEVVSLAYAEWELDQESLKDTYSNFSEYAIVQLDEAGFDTKDMYVTEEGELLTGPAAFFTKNNIAIGTDVTGYVLSTKTSAKTVSTDGSENTCDPEDYVETDPIPAENIARDEAITWKYFGIDENGEALIVGSVTSTTPTITLGGKGGYVNGPSTLKTICETMYSSDMGSARSITIEDVTRVLEYTGERGAYGDTSGTYVPTAKAKTINEIAAEIGYDMDGFLDSTPEEENSIGEYVADYYSINKTNDASEYNTEMQNLIYPGTSTTNPTLTTTYWLSSPCVRAYFDGSYADFAVRYVGSSYVNACGMFDSMDGSSRGSYAVRPVVTLTANVQVAYDGTTITLS